MRSFPFNIICMFRTKFYTTIEIVVGAGIAAGQDVNFQTQNQLQTIMNDKRVIVECVETYANTTLTRSPLSNNNTVATAADLKNAVLTLQIAGRDGFYRCPLARLNPIIPDSLAGGTYAPAAFNPLFFRDLITVDWTKSRVTLVAAPPGPTPFSYVFGVYYDYLPLPFEQV